MGVTKVGSAEGIPVFHATEATMGEALDANRSRLEAAKVPAPGGSFPASTGVVYLNVGGAGNIQPVYFREGGTTQFGGADPLEGVDTSVEIDDMVKRHLGVSDQDTREPQKPRRDSDDAERAKRQLIGAARGLATGDKSLRMFRERLQEAQKYFRDHEVRQILDRNTSRWSATDILQALRGEHPFNRQSSGGGGGGSSSDSGGSSSGGGSGSDGGSSSGSSGSSSGGGGTEQTGATSPGVKASTFRMDMRDIFDRLTSGKPKAAAQRLEGSVRNHPLKWAAAGAGAFVLGRKILG